MTQRLHELCRAVEAAERGGKLDELYAAAAELYGEAILELELHQEAQAFPEEREP